MLAEFLSQDPAGHKNSALMSDYEIDKEDGRYTPITHNYMPF